MIWIVLYAVLGICWGVFCNKMQKTLYVRNLETKSQTIGFLINSIFFPFSIMFAFYNEAIFKILEVKGKRSYLSNSSFGGVYIYPHGTQRRVRYLTFKGFKTKWQICTIEVDATNDSGLSYNHWKDIK